MNHQAKLRIARAGENLTAAAQLHQEGISEGFLSALGVRFLTQLYRAINAAPGSGVLVAQDGDDTVGFVAYTRDVAACYRWALRHRGLRLALPLLSNAFNIRFYKRAWETLRYPSRIEPENERSVAGSRAELLSMAVSPVARGSGVGKQLVAGVDDALRSLSVTDYFVVTHAIDERSNRFYQACGFLLVREFTNHGKPMNEYKKVLE